MGDDFDGAPDLRLADAPDIAELGPDHPLVPGPEDVPVIDLPWMHPTATEVPGVPACFPRDPPPPATVLPDSVIRAATYGYRFVRLAERLRGFLEWRTTYNREISSILGTVTRLRLVTELMWIAAGRNGAATPSTALKDAATALENRVLDLVDPGYPYERTHPSHHRATRNVAGEILDLFHDDEGNRALEEMIADDSIGRLERASVLGLIYGWMIQACEQALRTARAEEVIETLEDVLDRTSANAGSLVRSSAERLVQEWERAHDAPASESVAPSASPEAPPEEPEHAHDRIHAHLSRLHDIIDSGFKALRAVTRHRMAAAHREGTREAADRVIQFLQRYFELEPADVRILEDAMEDPTRARMVAAYQTLDRRVSPGDMRASGLGTLLEGGMVALSWASVVVLLTEPESERSLDWSLEVGMGAAGAVAQTIQFVGSFYMAETPADAIMAGTELDRAATRRALATVIEIAEAANVVLDIAQAAQNILEGAHDWHQASVTGNPSLRTYGGIQMTSGALVALGTLFCFPALTGVGVVIGLSAGALAFMAREQDEHTPPCCLLTLRMLRTLRLARVTEYGHSGSEREFWEDRLGISGEIRVVMDAAEDWDWWAIIPEAPSGTRPEEWEPTMREAQRGVLRRALFSNDEVELLVRDVIAGDAPRFRIEDITDAIGSGFSRVRL